VGGEDSWARRFAGVRAAAAATAAGATVGSWYAGNQNWSNNPVAFADHLGSSLSQTIAAAATPPGTSGGGFGGSGGGGSSGGGSSGGGGGGGGGSGGGRGRPPPHAAPVHPRGRQAPPAPAPPRGQRLLRGAHPVIVGGVVR